MDYDKILEKLKNTENLPTYDLLFALEKSILKEDVEILIHELAVFSGLSLRFIYSYENPLIYEDLPYFAFNLKKYLNFELNFFDIGTIEDVEPPFILIPQNCLAIERMNGTLLCEHVFDRYEFPLHELQSENRIAKLNPFRIERFILYERSKFKDIVYEIHKNYYERPQKLTNYYLGKNAFQMFISDLEDESKSFVLENNHILTRTIPDQLTALYGLKVYLLGVYHFLKKDEQKVLFEGIDALSDAIMFFREFERVSKDALLRNSFLSETRRRCINSFKRFVASYDHFVYILEKFI
ncbi:hypothetical protein [Caldisericum exile]|uniref:Uncharacterized protein n=1 Tax=Caldisericum exile (strain DSM 21853 / NBRC 104410 / AZM16c01) TaxID=511051 RepID=A0A7U6GFF0_CALEA|nr:hypothetical protein [Caldisericum exile]BAL81413.1 hypothetical protein CSE_12870 [Caldisericum exile AZM16c01]